MTNRMDCLQEILNTMVEDQYVAGANCLILQHGKEIGYYQAGYADIANQIPMNRDTICHLYSMSKPITAAAVFLLLEQGKIDLLDPVEKYLPTFANQQVQEGFALVPAKRSIVIKDLLNMQSGLLYPDNTCQAAQTAAVLFENIISRMGTSEEMTTIEIASEIGKLPLAFQPGSKWKYGTSADILGAIIEIASGMKLSAFLNKYFFEPLDMKDTGFYTPDEKKHRMAKTYTQTPNGPVEYHINNLGIDMDMKRPPLFESGGAGLMSTLDDYMHFGQMLLQGGEYNGKRIMGKQTIAFLTNGRLPKAITDDILTWSGLEGFQYGNLMRVCTDPGLCMYNASKGSYGWDGWLGSYFVNDPVLDYTFVYMQQRVDSGTTSYTRRLLNALASVIE